MNDVYLVNASKKDAVAAIKAAGNTLRMVVARPGSGVDATSSGASKGYGRAIATARAGSQGAGHVGASGDDVAGEVDRLAQSLKEKEREAEGLRARHKSLLEQHDKHLAALQEYEQERDDILRKVRSSQRLATLLSSHGSGSGNGGSVDGRLSRSTSLSHRSRNSYRAVSPTPAKDTEAPSSTLSSSSSSSSPASGSAAAKDRGDSRDRGSVSSSTGQVGGLEDFRTSMLNVLDASQLAAADIEHMRADLQRITSEKEAFERELNVTKQKLKKMQASHRNSGAGLDRGSGSGGSGGGGGVSEVTRLASERDGLRRDLASKASELEVAQAAVASSEDSLQEANATIKQLRTENAELQQQMTDDTPKQVRWFGLVLGGGAVKMEFLLCFVLCVCVCLFVCLFVCLCLFAFVFVCLFVCLRQCLIKRISCCTRVALVLHSCCTRVALVLLHLCWFSCSTAFCFAVFCVGSLALKRLQS